MFIVHGNFYVRTFGKKRNEKKILLFYFQFLFFILGLLTPNFLFSKIHLVKLLINFDSKFGLERKWKSIVNLLIFLPCLLRNKKKNIRKKKMNYFFQNIFHNSYFFRKNIIFWKFLIISSKNLYKKMDFSNKFFFNTYRFFFFSLNTSKSCVFFCHFFFSLRHFQKRFRFKIINLLTANLCGEIFSKLNTINYTTKTPVSLNIFFQVLFRQKQIKKSNERWWEKNIFKVSDFYYYFLRNQTKINREQILNLSFILFLINFEKNRKNTKNSIFIVLILKSFLNDKKFLQKSTKNFYQFMKHSYSFVEKSFLFDLNLLKNSNANKEKFLMNFISKKNKNFFAFFLIKMMLIFFPPASIFFWLEFSKKLKIEALFDDFFFFPIKIFLAIVRIFRYFLFPDKIKNEIFNFFEKFFVLFLFD
ncbi:hypothetical protein CMESO_507 (nucleomorph) [Chroomonas mesostigmatica CCMP1168]|uniref:Uncharacterized protein n=1 Tax=Chroomonas mesostigmatica CCMP1168 TaxID=1195612 RepID=J7G6H6_9CRYP|nr:hypothetical protein CMESO_507 [Chroomonas mesostigmatica CCMP1168]